METTTNRSTSLIIINTTFRWIVLSLALLASLFKALDSQAKPRSHFRFQILGFTGSDLRRWSALEP